MKAGNDRLRGEAAPLTCWSCGRPYTLAQRSDADGNCPACGVEIELDAARGEAAPEGQAVAYRHFVPCEHTPGYWVVTLGRTDNRGEEPLYTRPQPAAVAGDAVRALQSAVDQIESGDFDGGVSEACLSAMKSALSAAPAAPAPVAGDAAAALADFDRNMALCDRAPKLDRERVIGRLAIAHMDTLRAALAQDRASQAGAAGVPEWFGDVKRCLDDVATQQRAHGYGDGRMMQLLARMSAWEAAAPTPAADREVKS